MDVNDKDKKRQTRGGRGKIKLPKKKVCNSTSRVILIVSLWVRKGYWVTFWQIYLINGSLKNKYFYFFKFQNPHHIIGSLASCMRIVK